MDFDDNLVEEEGKPYNIRHRCFYFSKSVLQFVKELRFEIVFSSLFDQLVRSSTSIGANIIEGKAGVSKKDWLKFLGISLKSANETKYWLCLIRDSFDYDKNEINNLVLEQMNCQKLLLQLL